MIELTYYFGKDGEDEFIYIPPYTTIKLCANVLFKELHPDKSFEDVDIFYFVQEHEEIIKEDLYDLCKEQAYQEYLDYVEERKNPYTYRGIKEKDFY